MASSWSPILTGRIQEIGLSGLVAAISVAPNGTTAAVLVEGGAGAATPGAGSTPAGASTPAASDPTRSVVVVNSRGEVTRTVDDVVATLDAQPGMAEALAGETTIATVALGPNVDDLIVAFTDGLLVRLTTRRPAAVIPGSGNLASVQQVVWAPRGKMLAIVGTEKEGDVPAVFASPLRADGIDPVRIAPAPGRTTDRVAWLPDGSGVVFADAAGPLDALSLRSGRDLFVTPLRSDRRTLVAAAGVIGPAAGVVDFAVAPGSGSVAYTLYRAEGDEVRFNSLWVGSLDDNGSVQIALPDVVAIDGLAWTSGGLLVLARMADGPAPVILLVGPDGTASPVEPAASSAD